MKKVTIYSTPACVYCNMAKDFFAANSIQFENVNVAADPVKRQEMIKKSGQMGVPVIQIDNDLIIGFNKKVIAELLGVNA